MKNNYKYNNIIIYIFTTFIVTYLIYNIYFQNKLQAIFIACSFFVFIYFYKGKQFFAILLVFMFIAFLNIDNYYDLKVSNIKEIRVYKNSEFVSYGTVNGRKVEIFIKDEKIKNYDRIKIKGKFIPERKISKGIVGRFEVDDYKILEKDFISNLNSFKNKLFETIKDKIGARKSGIITSVSFGDSNNLDYNDREEMKVLGISHILAVSGLHLSLVYGVFSKIFGKQIALAFSFIYVIFIGMNTSALRAYVMIFILVFSYIVKRDYNSKAGLSIAGIIIICFKPYEVFSIGFWLSFLSTLSIIIFNKRISRLLYLIPNKIRGVISLSLSSQILTFPLLVFIFGEFSIGFILGNLIVVPIFNILIILGNLLIIFFKFEAIFNYILFLCYYVINIIDNISYFFKEIDIMYFNYVWIFIYSSILVSFYFYKKGFKKFIFFPIIMFVYVFVILYSPIPSIKYYKNSGLLISYSGTRVFLQTEEVIDKEKIKNIALVDKIYNNIRQIKIKDISLLRSGKNFKLKLKDNEYLLLLDYKKVDNCNVINFNDENLKNIWILDEKILKDY